MLRSKLAAAARGRRDRRMYGCREGGVQKVGEAGGRVDSSQGLCSQIT